MTSIAELQAEREAALTALVAAQDRLHEANRQVAEALQDPQRIPKPPEHEKLIGWGFTATRVTDEFDDVVPCWRYQDGAGMSLDYIMDDHPDLLPGAHAFFSGTLTVGDWNYTFSHEDLEKVLEYLHLKVQKAALIAHKWMAAPQTQKWATAIPWAQRSL